MEILVKAKLKYRLSEWGADFLCIDIKFKNPDKVLKQKERIYLCSSYWERYDSYQEFQENVLEILNDRERIERVIVNKTIESLKTYDRELVLENNHEKIKNAMKNNKFTVKVDLKTKKGEGIYL